MNVAHLIDVAVCRAPHSVLGHWPESYDLDEHVERHTGRAVTEQVALLMIQELFEIPVLDPYRKT